MSDVVGTYYEMKLLLKAIISDLQAKYYEFLHSTYLTNLIVLIIIKL